MKKVIILSFLLIFFIIISSCNRNDDLFNNRVNTEYLYDKEWHLETILSVYPNGTAVDVTEDIFNLSPETRNHWLEFLRNDKMCYHYPDYDKIDTFDMSFDKDTTQIILRMYSTLFEDSLTFGKWAIVSLDKYELVFNTDSSDLVTRRVWVAE